MTAKTLETVATAEFSFMKGSRAVFHGGHFNITINMLNKSPKTWISHQKCSVSTVARSLACSRLQDGWVSEIWESVNMRIKQKETGERKGGGACNHFFKVSSTLTHPPVLIGATTSWNKIFVSILKPKCGHCARYCFWYVSGRGSSFIAYHFQERKVTLKSSCCRLYFT